MLLGVQKFIDPLSVNRQGNDRGIQYRTGIYYTDDARYGVSSSRRLLCFCKMEKGGRNHQPVRKNLIIILTSCFAHAGLSTAGKTAVDVDAALTEMGLDRAKMCSFAFPSSLRFMIREIPILAKTHNNRNDRKNGYHV